MMMLAALYTLLSWIEIASPAANACPSSQDSVARQVVLMQSRRENPVSVLLPEPFDSAETYPLLIALHGKGGDAAQLTALFSRYRDKSVMVAIPQGQYPSAHGTGYSWFYETQDRSLWEEADSLCVDHIVDAAREVRTLFKTSRTFIMGFSQGAALAYMTGLKNPGTISGIIAVAGAIPEIDRPGSLLKSRDIQQAQSLRILVARGNADPLLSRSDFIRQVTFFSLRGFTVSDFEFSGGHTLPHELLEHMFEWIENK